MSDIHPNIWVGDWISKSGGDYSFVGRVTSVYRKFSRDLKNHNGPWRVDAQNADGVVHIFNPSQITKIDPPNE